MQRQLDAAESAPLPPGRPPSEVRARARAFTVGAVAEALFDVTAYDPAVAGSYGIQMTAGPLVAQAMSEESRVAADDLECRAWRCLLARVRRRAGETQ